MTPSRLLTLAALLSSSAAQAATLGYIYVGPEKDFGYNTSTCWRPRSIEVL